MAALTRNLPVSNNDTSSLRCLAHLPEDLPGARLDSLDCLVLPHIGFAFLGHSFHLETDH